MNPTRRRRLAFVALLVLASGVATALVAMALQRNVAYLYTPAEPPFATTDVSTG